MPIKGRSEIRWIPRVGKIHLGIKAKSQSGNEYPRAVDYFVVKPDDSTSETAAIAFHEAYGDKPKEIKVCFPYDDPETFFPQYFKSYTKGKGLFCRGDGETAKRNVNGESVEIACDPKTCSIYQAHKCKEIANLQFFLPEVNGIGVWQIDTSSFHGTVKINSAIDMVRALTGGKIKMIPLTLRLVPKEVSPNGEKKTVYVLDLQLDNIKLVDFMNHVPLISAAFTPEVEPVRADEMPEDLYIEDNLVDEESTEKSSDVQEDEGEIGILKEADKRTNAQGTMVGLAKIVTQNGEIVEGITINQQIISTFELLEGGKQVRYQVEPSQVFHGRNELCFIVPA